MNHSIRTIHCVLVAIMTLALLPIVVMLLVSTSPPQPLTVDAFFAWPRNITFDAWHAVWSDICIGGSCNGLWPWIGNSLRIAIPALICSLALGALSGFALVPDTPLRRILSAALFLALFLPPQATLYPMIFTLRQIGVFGSSAGLVVAHIIWGLPFTSLLFRTFFRSMPEELFKMAQVDGAGPFELYLRVVAPMALPVTASASVLQFTYIWNDYIFGLTFGDSTNQPVTVAVQALASANYGSGNHALSMAAAFIATLPTLFLYIACGRFVTSGMTKIPMTDRTP